MARHLESENIQAALPLTFPIRLGLAPGALEILRENPTCAYEYFDALQTVCEGVAAQQKCPVRESYALLPLAVGARRQLNNLLAGTSEGWEVVALKDGVFSIAAHSDDLRHPARRWEPGTDGLDADNVLRTTWASMSPRLDLFAWDIGVPFAMSESEQCTVTALDEEGLTFRVDNAGGSRSEWVWEFEPATLARADPGPPRKHPLELFVRRPIPV